MEDPVVQAVVEVAKERSKEVYEDGLKGATKEGGQALQTIVGLFNNVILYPLKKANITFKYKYEQFEREMKDNYDKIPEANRIEPPINIVGPAIESLKYTIDTKELREMYMNLLTSSMDIEKIEYAHPSYVEIIKQLTPLDALVLKKAKEYNDLIRCSRITFSFDNKSFSGAMPKIFAPDILCEDYSPFLVSASIENLCRLGLMIYYNVGVMGGDYSFTENHEYVRERYELYKNNNVTKNYIIKHTREALGITNFGENFIKACF